MKKPLLLVKMSSSDKDLLRKLLGHAYVHPQVVPLAPLAALLRPSTFPFLLSLLMKHRTASLLSLLLPIFTHFPPFYSKTRFLHTLFNIRPHVFLQTALLKLSALLALKALLDRNQFSFLASADEKLTNSFQKHKNELP